MDCKSLQSLTVVAFLILRLTVEQGTWALTGGKMEFGESWADCAKRETKEEANLDLDDISLLGVLNMVKPEINYHFVIFFVKGTATNPDDVKNLEPDKCHEWKWVTFPELLDLQPKFFPLERYLEELGINPFL